MRSTPTNTARPRRPDFVAPIQKPQRRGPECLPYYWHPHRVSIRFLSGPIADRVREIGDDLRVVWNPITERWQVFCQDGRMQHPICSGWKLLFIHQTAQGGYMPPDERLLARIFAISAKHQGVNGKQYFDRIVQQDERDREARERQWAQDSIDAAMPSFEYSQIKNIGKGNKFAEYLA